YIGKHSSCGQPTAALIDEIRLYDRALSSVEIQHIFASGGSLDSNHVNTIQVGSTGFGGLPAITDPVIIDGYTQPGASQNTLAAGDNAVLLIQLDGTFVGESAQGLQVLAGSSALRGLVINRFNTGVRMSGQGGNVIEGNFMGTDPTGLIGLGNI